MYYEVIEARVIDELVFEVRFAGRNFAANLDQVVESLAELLTPDSAAMLIGLAEYDAIERVENSLEQIDDSNGGVGGIVQELGGTFVPFRDNIAFRNLQFQCSNIP
ncbi:MAG: hypothetical protein PHF31_04560 [Methylobacter sp.]|nr:hypothetical protein [Methylobacter sp.]